MEMIRRTVLGATAAAAVVSVVSAASGATRTRDSSGKKATYVLVHGGGHGGWCWKRVADPLRVAGHDVYTPTMTGVADKSHLLSPAVDLDMNITDIVNLLKWEDLTNVILVGHSYGGMVITGVADRALDRIGHMVYLDAAHPRNGEPLWKQPPSGVGTIEMLNGTEVTALPTDMLLKTALGLTRPDDYAWGKAKITPQPLKTFTQPLKLQNEEAVHKLPTTDIWRSMILAKQRKAGMTYSWAQQIWEINSPAHDLMITDPVQVTEMLLRLSVT